MKGEQFARMVGSLISSFLSFSFFSWQAIMNFQIQLAKSIDALPVTTNYKCGRPGSDDTRPCLDVPDAIGL